MKKKTVLITGGAGFIGSHLCDFFIDQDYQVICLDNLITGSKRNISHLFSDKNFKFIKHNISKPFSFPDPIHYILHFASPASPPDYLRHPIPTLKVGALGTHHSLGIAKRKKSVFLLASTSEVYGDPLVNPQKESYWGNVNPIGPRGVYDEAKRFAEALTLAYYRQHRVNAKIVRIFNTYGPRMRIEDGRVIPNFISQALTARPLTLYGNGSQTRSYCYVSDLVQGIQRVLFSKLNQPVNLGNPNEMTVLKLGRLILKLTGSKSSIVYKPLPVDDPKRRCPDISLAIQILGWSPKAALSDGLKDTIIYFRKHLK